MQCSSGFAATTSTTCDPQALSSGSYSLEMTTAVLWATASRQEYGAERLARPREVKRRYDPDNRFRFNHTISPD